MQVEYRNIAPAELNIRLFSHFTRRQVVTDCLRRSGDRWEVRSDPFTDDWSAADYERLIGCLINTLQTGGAVFGAFIAGELKGFASVEALPLGSRGQYIDLSSLHVSEELRRRGIGTRRNGRHPAARKSCISPHTRRLKLRLFTAGWAVPTPGNTRTRT